MGPRKPSPKPEQKRGDVRAAPEEDGSAEAEEEKSRQRASDDGMPAEDANGGAGPGVSPKTAVSVGLKVDRRA